MTFSLYGSTATFQHVVNMFLDMDALDVWLGGLHRCLGLLDYRERGLGSEVGHRSIAVLPAGKLLTF